MEQVDNQVSFNLGRLSQSPSENLMKSNKLGEMDLRAVLLLFLQLQHLCWP